MILTHYRNPALLDAPGSWWYFLVLNGVGRLYSGQDEISVS
jgi:hypothetical protein